MISSSDTSLFVLSNVQVQLEQVDSAEEAALLRSYIEEHVERTESALGEGLLSRWDGKIVAELQFRGQF